MDYFDWGIERNGRRGRVMGMDQIGQRQVLRAEVPLAALSRYQTDLKSMTSARASYAMELAYYQPVPHEVQEKILAAQQDEA